MRREEKDSLESILSAILSIVEAVFIPGAFLIKHPTPFPFLLLHSLGNQFRI